MDASTSPCKVARILETLFPPRREALKHKRAGFTARPKKAAAATSFRAARVDKGRRPKVGGNSTGPKRPKGNLENEEHIENVDEKGFWFRRGQA